MSRLLLLATLVAAIFLSAAYPAHADHSSSETPTGTVHFFETDLLNIDKRGRTTLAASDTRGILSALEAGDTSRLVTIRNSLERAPGPEPAFNVMLLALCDAAMARTQGDLFHADHIIQEALRRAAPWSNPAQSVNPFNFMLATFLTGDLLLENRLPEWAGGKHFIDRAFRAPLVAFYDKPDLVLTDLDQVTLTVPESGVLPINVKGPRSDEVSFNPFQTLVGGVTTATAGTLIDLDGSQVHAVINTGSVLGAVPQALQRSHHWPVVGTVSSLRDDTIQAEKADLVQVPSLTLGHTIFRNQLMIVAKTSHVVIGLQSLGVLNHVVMTDHGMSFGPDAPFSCHRHAALQSDIGGLDAAFLLPVSYDGQRHMAALMTGDNSPEPLVIQRPTLAAQAGMKAKQKFETGTGMISENAVLRRTTLRLDHHNVQAHIRYRVGDSTKPPILTMSALEGAKLSFDLHQGVACLD
ncbi:hypothetical protein [Asaia krungthepensis]|uniref:hypothetical protein n=1 Tax=Asaia krungthepensis TaxID=220990 RepID=UPI00222F5D60|nr:hypothetical protein [Asaia krungthepensis]